VLWPLSSLGYLKPGLAKTAISSISWFRDVVTHPVHIIAARRCFLATRR